MYRHSVKCEKNAMMSVFAYELRRRKSYPVEIVKFVLYFSAGFSFSLFWQMPALPGDSRLPETDAISEKASCAPCSTTDQAAAPFKPVTMYEVIPFDYFTQSYVYNNYYEEAKHGVLRHEKDDIRDIMEQTLNAYNLQSNSLWKINSLQYGYRRFDPGHGEEYLLEIELKNDNSEKERVYFEVLKPFAPAVMTSVKRPNNNQVVHILLPISHMNRQSAVLKKFLDSFVKIALRDKAIALKVIEMTDQKNTSAVATYINQYLQGIETKLPQASSRIEVLKMESSFSRGVALDYAARRLNKYSLIFFCDVDLHLSLDFFTRCRTNTVASKQVFYPMVFTQFHPKVVQEFSPRSKVENLMDISKYTGHWVHYGYGMACMYTEDYLKVGGFNLNLKGWGGEDVDLYKKHVDSGYKIIRAMDPGLIHVHHPKSCSKSLATNQFQMCVQAAGEDVGSRQQLGRFILEKHDNFLTGEH